MREIDRMVGNYWHTTNLGLICVVAVKANMHVIYDDIRTGLEWKAYIAVVYEDFTEEESYVYTMNWGSKVLEDVARAYFPHLKDFPFLW